MGPAFWAEMPAVFADLDADPEVRAIVLTGSGSNFSYGLDLMAMGGTLPSSGGGDAVGSPARGLPHDAQAHAAVHHRGGRLPHPHHRRRCTAGASAAAST